MTWERPVIDDHYERAAELAAHLEQRVKVERASGESVIALAQLHAQLSIARSLGLIQDQAR